MVGTVILCLTLLFLHIPSGGHAQENIVSGSGRSPFEVRVSKADATFAIPYRGLNIGDCFRLVCRDPGWVWGHNSVVYNGKLSSNKTVNGQFKDIPLPGDVQPGLYHFDVMVGITSGGIVCFSDPLPLVIRVTALNEGGKLTICSGTMVNYIPECLKLMQSEPEKYRWKRSTTKGIREEEAAGIGEIHEVLTNEEHQPVKVVYQFEATPDPCSDGGAFSVEVTVNPVINFEIINKTLDLCSGELCDIKISPPIEGVTYSWKPEMYGSAGASAGTGDEIRQNLYYAETPATIVYRVGVVLPTGNGCTPEQSTVVRLKALPEIALDWTEPTNPVTVGSPISFTVYPDNYNSYRFSVNGKPTEQSVGELICYDWLEGKDNEITVKVASNEGCWNADTLNIMGPTLNLPNWFKPGEGNAKFLYDPQLINFKLEVFNRNGGQLYSGKEGWDGHYKGQLVPSETYLYVVHYTTPDGRNIIRRHHVYVNTAQ